MMKKEVLERIAQNVMEYLVTEEIERQIKLDPANAALEINKLDLAIYALNRLPVLYASSKQEIDWQMQLAEKKYRQLVSLTVSKAFTVLGKLYLRK